MQSNGTSSLQQKSEFGCQLQATDIIQPKKKTAKGNPRRYKEVQGLTYLSETEKNRCHCAWDCKSLPRVTWDKKLSTEDV